MKASGLAALLLATGVLAACSETDQGIAAPDNQETLLLAQNAAAQARFEALIAEINPHILYDDVGRWRIADGAQLSKTAAEFVQAAQSASAGQSVENPARSGVAALSYTTGGGVRGIGWYWWGARVSLRSGDVQGVSEAWRTAGGAAAVRTFLSYFGYSSWLAGAAGYLVPMYAWTIWYVDRTGGYRGVHLYVPWSLVPTFITPQ